VSHNTININFAHANGFPAGSYQSLFNCFEENVKIIALDKFAHNPMFPLNDNWLNQVDELIDYAQQHKKNEDYSGRMVAMGHSFGAVISYLACCKRPDLFDQLIMLDPPLITGLASMVFKVAKNTRWIDKITPSGITQIRKSSWHLEDDLVAYFKRKNLFKDMQIECIRDYVDSVTHEIDGRRKLHFDINIEANIFRTIPTNLKQHYGQLKIPATLITGKFSPVCVPKLYRPFLKGNPSVMHIELPKGAHMFPLEHPTLLADTIKPLLEKWL